MNETPKTFILGVGDIPALIEEEFKEVLIEPEEGYYRYNDLEPFLPYRNSAGMPCSYWLHEANTLTKREVNNLAVVRGVVYNEEGIRCARIYRVGDLQLNPQIPVIGHRVVKEYLQSFIELSRCWYPYSEDRVLGTGNLYHRFHKFIKPELMELFDRTRWHENEEHMNEIMIEYMRCRGIIPSLDHVFGMFMQRVITMCYTIIRPLADYIVQHPWTIFELQRIQSNDFLLTECGDFRIKQWEASNLQKR